ADQFGLDVRSRHRVLARRRSGRLGLRLRHDGVRLRDDDDRARSADANRAVSEEHRLGAPGGRREPGRRRPRHLRVAEGRRLSAMLAGLAEVFRAHPPRGDDDFGRPRRPANEDRDRGHRAETHTTMMTSTIMRLVVLTALSVAASSCADSAAPTSPSQSVLPFKTGPYVMSFIGSEAIS